MTIIKYLLPSDDHTIKKLLLVFWEIWPKTDPQGKLRPEMILVCDAYRKVWCKNGVYQRFQTHLVLWAIFTH